MLGITIIYVVTAIACFAFIAWSYTKKGKEYLSSTE